MTSSFAFVAMQLDERMVSVFGSASFETVGLNRKAYHICEIVDMSFHDTWEEKVNTSYLAYYGYDTDKSFKDVYARAHIYNSLRYAPDKTIREFIEFYSKKVKHFFDRDVDCNTKNLHDFLMSFSLEELLCVGW